MTNDVTMGGWDIAFAMRYGDINAKIGQIVANDRSANGAKAAFPDKIDMSTQNALGVSTTVKADVTAPWRLRSGGDGRDIVLGIELTNLSLDIPSPLGDVTLDNGTASIAVRAKLIGQADGSFVIGQRNSAGLSDITYDFSSSTTTAQLDSVRKATLDAVLNGWIKTLMPSFGQIVSRIDTSLATKNPDWAWLIPKASEAIVREIAGRDEADQMLVIRSMTSSSNAPIDSQLSGQLIPDPPLDASGKPDASKRPTVGIAINPALFLEKMVKPVLPALFDDAKPGDFRVAGTRIATSKTFTVANFIPKDNVNPVAAQFVDFGVEIIGDRIEFTAGIRFPFEGVDLSTTYRSQMQLSLAVPMLKPTSGGAAQPFPTIAPTIKTLAAQDTQVTANQTLKIASYITGAAVAIAGAIFSAAAVQRGAADVPDEGAAVADGQGNVDIPLDDIGNDAPEQLGDDFVDDEEASDVIEDGAQGQIKKFRLGNTGKYWAKTMGTGVLSMLLGGGIAAIPTIVQEVQDGTARDVEKNLEKFVKDMLKVVALPEGVAEDYELVTAEIAGTLVLGARLKGT